MLYRIVKYLHVTCVMLSIGGFCLRGILLLRNSALVARHGFWLRVAAGLAALAVFGWIVSVAISKHPNGFLA